VWIVFQIWADRASLPWFLKPVLFLLCLALLVPVVAHCGFTILYGNANNEAWTDSWMVDVIAPPEFFQWGFMENYKVATNPDLWLPSAIAPHVPTSLPKCGPRMYVRFMAHRISPKARLAKIVEVEGLTFVGSWVMAVGTGFRQTRPKVFTDLASGNDFFFNNMMRHLFVDRHNGFTPFNNTFVDGKHSWTIHGGPTSPYLQDPHVHWEMTGTGNFYEKKKFIMDQYSCMQEAMWLEAIVGKRWCFYKVMEAATVEEVKGYLTWPTFEGKLEFPSGDVEDCSKPYVRGIYANDLHWVRDTYSC